MSNLREAAQDALAALNGVLDTYGEPLDKLSIAGGTFEALVCRDAITALRAALAQPEPEWVLSQNELPPPYIAREPIAQPEPAAPSEDRPLFDPEYPDSGYCTNAEWSARKAAQTAAPTVEPVGWLESPHGAFRANPLYRHDFPPQSMAWQIPVYATPPREALNLIPVIQWLENGCDPLEAAKELRVYQATLGGPRNE